jgi:hypothetical protein
VCAFVCLSEQKNRNTHHAQCTVLVSTTHLPVSVNTHTEKKKRGGVDDVHACLPACLPAATEMF